MVKEKACVFISGVGSNLKSIIYNSRESNFPINVSLVLSNNNKAQGINHARKFAIPFKILDGNIDKFENTALKEISDRNIKLICLAGFMRILSKNFIRRFKGKIINIHPSLLPRYKGLNTFNRALKNKDKFTGCTVHYVDEKLDNGRIIIKKRVNINNDDNESDLKKRVQSEERIVYSMAIRKIFKK